MGLILPNALYKAERSSRLAKEVSKTLKKGKKPNKHLETSV